jgi:hypothetical protein
MYRIFALLFCLAFVVGCAPTKPEQPEKTQAEIREMQTKMFDTDNFKLVMKSVLNVLQDENFIVKNVAMDLGFLTATKDADIESPYSSLYELQRTNARWEKHEMIEATINVSEFGKTIRVRANFQKKVMDNKGAVMKIEQISDPAYYQEFFSKVDKGVFIQQQNI